MTKALKNAHEYILSVQFAWLPKEAKDIIVALMAAQEEKGKTK